jgi:hypothetical protein
MAIGAGLPALALGLLRPRLVRSVSFVLLVLFGWAAFARTFARVDRSRFYDVETIVGAWMDHSPSRTTLVTSDFQTIFALYYLRAIEGRRPDTAIVHRHFLAYPGYRDELLLREPELAPLLGDYDVRADVIGQMRAAGRPVAVEYDLDLDERLGPNAESIDGNVPPLDPQTRRYLGWQAYLSAHRACRLADPSLFEQRYARTVELLGDQAPEIAALRQNCRH